ncbi:MAG: kynureninase, partial [Anaerolineae bacterium]
QPKTAPRYLAEELEAWKELAVEGHFRGPRPWKGYHEQFAGALAELTGARENEVVCMNGLTVNLHLMMVSFFRPSGSRRKILMERPAFPSDRYAVVSQLEFHGLDPADCLVEVAPREGEAAIRDEDVAAAIDAHADELAMVLLPGVQYLSGQVMDMAGLTRRARACGALVGLDLAHAVGNVPLSLHDWDCDFAVWCSYKYLNGGPGAVAGAFVHERHGSGFSGPRFAGWWGHDAESRFLMGPDFHPAPGAAGWQLSNPPVLGMAALLAALEIFMEAGMERLRAKSLDLTGYLADRITATCADRVAIVTPLAPERRGCQLSLRLAGGAERGRGVFRRLAEAGVICDWREPDIIRAAPAPLYNSYTDVDRFVQALCGALS